MTEATAAQQNDRDRSKNTNNKRIKIERKWGITIYKLAVVCTGL